MSNVKYYNDGYVEFGKHAYSRVKMVDCSNTCLLKDYSVGDSGFDEVFHTGQWEYSLSLPRSSSLHEDLNAILLCCNALFTAHKKQRNYCVIRKAKYARFAFELMQKLRGLQIDAKSDEAQLMSGAIIETISTTGVPIHTFSSAFISICSNIPHLKYLAADYRQRINQFVSSVTAVDSRMQRRVFDCFIGRMGGYLS